MKISNFVFALLFVTIYSLYIHKPHTYATSTYGGEDGNNTPITIDKQVAKPTYDGNLLFVDHILASDKKYRTGDAVVFKLIAKNTSDNIIKNVSIVDEFPTYLTYLQGPGVFDPTTNKLQIELDQLQAQETKIILITAKIVDTMSLPIDRSVFCVSNQASIYQNTTQKDSDNTQVCFERTVLGVTTVPKTGPEKGILLAVCAGMLGISGIYMQNRLKTII